MYSLILWLLQLNSKLPPKVTGKLSGMNYLNREASLGSSVFTRVFTETGLTGTIFSTKVLPSNILFIQISTPRDNNNKNLLAMYLTKKENNTEIYFVFASVSPPLSPLDSLKICDAFLTVPWYLYSLIALVF